MMAVMVMVTRVPRVICVVALVAVVVVVLVVVFDPYEYHMDLCNELYSAGRLCGAKKNLTLNIVRKLFNQFCSYLLSL